jgi:hypothetical protein
MRDPSHESPAERAPLVNRVRGKAERIAGNSAKEEKELEEGAQRPPRGEVSRPGFPQRPRALATASIMRGIATEIRMPRLARLLSISMPCKSRPWLITAAV